MKKKNYRKLGEFLVINQIRYVEHLGPFNITIIFTVTNSRFSSFHWNCWKQICRIFQTFWYIKKISARNSEKIRCLLLIIVMLWTSNATALHRKRTHSGLIRITFSMMVLDFGQKFLFFLNNFLRKNAKFWLWLKFSFLSLTLSLSHSIVIDYRGTSDIFSCHKKRSVISCCLNLLLLKQVYLSLKYLLVKTRQFGFSQILGMMQLIGIAIIKLKFTI